MAKYTKAGKVNKSTLKGWSRTPAQKAGDRSKKGKKLRW
tara:strand:- start:1105 stop:1221 length:117 start_codon:yes stop_codon:yes gene_type:complete